MKSLLGLAMAAAFAAPAFAASLPAPGRVDPGSIILIEGGCGPYAHRDYYGYCRPNEAAPGYTVRWVCPPGWHYGGGRCWPNG